MSRSTSGLFARIQKAIRGRQKTKRSCYERRQFLRLESLEPRTVLAGDAPVAFADGPFSVVEDQTLTVDAASGVLSNDTDAEADPLTPDVTDDVDFGVLTMEADGSFVYTPNTDFVGADSFTYVANDGTSDSNPITVTINVTASNDAPVAVDDAYSVQKDGVLNITAALGVLANDTDVDDDESVLTAAVDGAAVNGTVTLNLDGSFTFTPTPGFSGIASFKYAADDDDSATSNLATVTITVNAPPTLSDVLDQTTTENTAIADVPFTVGDAETDPADLTPTATSSNQTLIPNGNIVFGGSGANRTLTITPATGETGAATITLTISDGDGGMVTDTFQVTVTAPNTDPTITDVADLSTNEDIATGSIAITVGDAETDPAALILTAESDNQTLIPDANLALGGSGANRTLVITPADNESGTATISLTLSDGNGGAVTDTFVVTVTSANDVPTISDIVDQTTPLDTAIVDLPFTIGDVETDVATIVPTAVSDNQTLIPNANIVFGGTGANRTVTITPATGQTGTATIAITVSDGDGGVITDTFEVTVTPPNTDPTISDVADLATEEDTATGSIAITVGDAETDPADLTLTAESSNETLIPNANLVLSGSGASRTLVITPAGNESGTATITLTLSDGNGGAVTDTFVVTVTSANDAPTISAVDDQSTTEDTATGSIAVTIGDADPSDTLTLTAESSDTALVPNSGIAITGTGANRTIVITPAANQSGTATITLTLSDGNGGETTETFDVVVSPVNDAPTISAVADLSTNEDTATGSIAVTLGDLDPADPLTLTAESSNTALVPNSGIAITGTGANRTIVVTPAANQSGTATITLTVSDGNGGAATETFVLTVTAVNDAPTAVNDTYTTAEDTLLNISAVSSGVLANDTDPDNDALTTVLVLAPSSGQLVLNTNGTFTYTPALNFTGSVTFQYRARDTTSTNSGIATVTINVTGANDAPTAAANSYSTSIGNTLIVSQANGVLANDTDPDSGTTLTAVLATNVSNGTLSLAANGSFTYTPNAGFSGTDSFTYRASDGTLQSSPVTVTITVSAVNTGEPIIVGPTSGVRGQTLSYDLSTIGGTSANVTYSIDWNGDGTNDQTVTGPGAGTTVTHVFATSGSFNVRVQAGSPAQSTTLAVTITDTLRVGRTFVVGGTSGNDTIVVQKVGRAGIRVLVNGTAVGGVQTGVRTVEISGGDGNDSIAMPANVNATAIFRGGAGNDRLLGGKLADFLFGDAGNDVLNGAGASDFISGGAGNDTAIGGVGHDVLFGGDGVDSLVGGSHHNLLIGGTTEFDDNFKAQKAILHAWVAGGTFEQRMNRLNFKSKGGLKLIENQTVESDGDADRIVSRSSRDWIFAAIADQDQIEAKRRSRVVSFI